MHSINRCLQLGRQVKGDPTISGGDENFSSLSSGQAPLTFLENTVSQREATDTSIRHPCARLSLSVSVIDFREELCDEIRLRIHFA